jgi:hypothetical protein
MGLKFFTQVSARSFSFPDARGGDARERFLSSWLGVAGF